MAESEIARRLREAYGAYSRGDLEVVLELMDENVELVPPESSPEPAPLHGHDAIRDYMTPNLFDEQSAEPEEIIEERDRILVVAHARARGRGSGVEIDQTVFHLLHLDGERVVRFEVFMEREEALAALRAG